MPFFVSLNMEEGFKFPKREKVVSKYDIDLLFGKARSVREGVLLMRYVWRDSQPDELPIRVLMVVPKRRIKLAVNRNRVKRQLREIYRLNKPKLTQVHDNKTLLLTVMFQGSAMPEYEDLASCFTKGSAALMKKIDKA